MTEHLKPRDAADVEQAVNWALAGGVDEHSYRERYF